MGNDIEPIDVLQKFVREKIKAQLKADEYSEFIRLVNDVIDYNYGLGYKRGEKDGRE